MIEGLDQVTPRRNLRDHFLDRAELADRVARFLVIEKSGELHATRRMPKRARTELIRHAECNRRQIRSAQHLPGAKQPIGIGRDATLRKLQVVKYNPAQSCTT